jgi:quercetin dioxygenase-like cupin family protein
LGGMAHPAQCRPASRCMIGPMVRYVSLFAAAAAMVFAADPQTLVDNDSVRVVKVTDQPHAASTPHEHKLNRVMIYLQAGTQKITPQGGAATTLRWKAGEVKWSPAGGTHVSEVTSNAPVTIVEVEVKKEGTPGKTANVALDPVKVDPADYKVEFENAQVRVVRVNFPAHHKVPQHEHVLNRVVVYLTDQDGLMTSVDGKVDKGQHKAGEANWGGPAKHTEENLMDKPCEAIVVEFKY